MHIYGFEKLQVWQDAKRFTVYIYKLTDRYPSDEKFGMVSQLRRASISIGSNIAEGSARKSPRDQAHFYHISYSSLLEVLNLLIISSELGFIGEKDLLYCRQEIETISNKLNALRKAVLKNRLMPPSTTKQFND